MIGSPARTSPKSSLRQTYAPIYSPQARIFNSRKKMTLEMEQLQEKIAATEKAKAVLVGATTKLHLEYRMHTEELNSTSAKLTKKSDKLATKTKHYIAETARMKAEIEQLKQDLDQTRQVAWRSRFDSPAM